MKQRFSNKIMVSIALVLCLISMVGSSYVQTGGGDVKVSDMTWVTPSGKTMSALLFVPDSASADNPAPAIVTSHGWYNSREMQDLNYIEYSRRGYVVVAISMYGHGNSETVAPEEWAINGTGMYDAVELVSTLPYVNSSKIGITGHSNGARAANWSIDEDNKKEVPLISSVLLVANDANYRNPETKEYYNKYGSRDVGIVAAQYDEFFFRTYGEDGSVSAPRDYMESENAQSFLNFGIDPSGIAPKQSYQFYTETIDGEETTRVIFNPYQIHPWNHFSKSVVTNSLDFFDKTLGTPNAIDSSKQVWQFKAAFNGLGLIGFVFFIIYFTKLLLETSLFASLKATSDVKGLDKPRGKELAWFIVPLILSATFSGLSAMYLFKPILALHGAVNFGNIFNQLPNFYIGVWSLLSGLFMGVVTWVVYKLHGSKTGLDLEARGLKQSANTILKSMGLALTVTVSAFMLVFIADYLFTSDFRLWVIAIRAFGPDKISIALRYAPFFLIFYLINSVVLNVFNYIEFSSKEWVNTLCSAFLSAVGVIVVVIIQYSTFFSTGHVFFGSSSGILGIWMIPVAVFLMVAAVISRSIYRATNNPYLGGMIVGLVITIISVTNTLTQL